MQAFGPFVPTMVGGAADLIHSTFTEFEGDDDWFTPEHAGRNVAWGVREHGMGAAVNGLALHGGIVKPFGSTFFVFTDYMRPPIRLSALMKLDVRLDLQPRLGRGRRGRPDPPADRAPRGDAGDPEPDRDPPGRRERGRPRPGALILEDLRRPDLPRALAPERPDRSTATTSRRPRACARGAYVLADADSPDVVLVATGAEVGDRARRARAPRRARASRRASSRCRAGSSSRRRAPTTATRSCRRACRRSRSRPASTFGWSRWVDASIGIDTLRRLGQGRQGARALRDQPGGGRRARPAPRSPSSPRPRSVEGHASASPRPSRSRRRVGIVIDVLRATSTICQALAGGYERGRPASARSRTPARSRAPASRSPASGTTSGSRASTSATRRASSPARRRGPTRSC